MISVQLENSKTNYIPGEAIRGKVAWSELDSGASHLEVRLIWYSVGKGTRDIGLIASRSIECSGLPTGDEPFEFVAPHRPFSFSASLLTLTWAVELIQFPSKHSVSTKLVISPTGQEIQLSKDLTDQAKAKAIISSSNFDPDW